MFPITLFFPSSTAPPPSPVPPVQFSRPVFLFPFSATQMSHKRSESILNPVQPVGQHLSHRLRRCLDLHHNKS